MLHCEHRHSWTTKKYGYLQSSCNCGRDSLALQLPRLKRRLLLFLQLLWLLPGLPRFLCSSASTAAASTTMTTAVELGGLMLSFEKAQPAWEISLERMEV